MTRIALLDDYANVARNYADWDRLPDGVQFDVFNDHLTSEDDIAARLEPYDVVIGIRERTLFPKSLINRLPNLKLLITPCMRNNGMDMQACRDRGIPVCGTDPGRPATAELAWLLILALAKQLIPEDRGVEEGHWGVGRVIGLSGRTIGVIGLGKLGSRVAEVARAFEMNVLAWSPNLTDERAAEQGATRVELDELLAKSQFVTLHIISSERTRGLIGARELGLMQPDSFLINTSRGPLVDEAALINALREGQIGGAGLDVFDVEPLPADHPLRKMDNVVTTPHLGGFTEDNYKLWFSEALEDIEAWLDGKPVRVLN